MSNTDTDKTTRAYNSLPAALKQMGYSELREAQKPCIDAIFQGKNVFCILPTGGGKTAIMALPTIAFKCQTLVLSPLIALMKDQVDSLNRKHVRAAAINSVQTEMENWKAVEEWASGELSVLYVAPERLANDQLQLALKQNPPALVVVDECHCMSQWSSSFRPAYASCGAIISELKPRQIVAMTATATTEIVDDVKRILGLSDIHIEQHYEARHNLQLSCEFVDDTALHYNVLKWIRKIEGSIIVYCNTVTLVNELVEYLKQAGEDVVWYHGQMTNMALREYNQDQFMSGQVRVMVATNAFGMGIDKPDIRGIIHANVPSSVEAIAQEVGRASRDGKPAICHMLASPHGFHMQEYFWNNSNPESFVISRVFNYLKRVCDKDNIVTETIASIEQSTQCETAAAAMNYLTSLGVISRHKPEAKVATVTIQTKDPSALTKVRRKVYDAIITNGIYHGDSAAKNPVYKIDLKFLASVVGSSEASVKSHINQMKKDEYILYEAPFSGKATKIERELTKADLDAAQTRRNLEWEKVAAARMYCTTPDDEKHAYMTRYFLEA